MQANANLAAVGQTRHAVAAYQVQQLFGQARSQGQGVQVFDQTEQLAYAPCMQAQHRLVKFGVYCKNFPEIGFGYAQNRAVAMGIGIVRAPVAVENCYIAEPDAGFDISQRDLLARK